MYNLSTIKWLTGWDGADVKRNLDPNMRLYCPIPRDYMCHFLKTIFKENCAKPITYRPNQEYVLFSR